MWMAFVYFLEQNSRFVTFCHLSTSRLKHYYCQFAMEQLMLQYWQSTVHHRLPPTSFFYWVRKRFGMLHCYIVGDVNIHLDDVSSPITSKLIHLLNCSGLQDCIETAAHKRLYQLDVLVARVNRRPLSVTVHPPGMISDHSLIVASVTFAHSRTSELFTYYITDCCFLVWNSQSIFRYYIRDFHVLGNLAMWL